MKENNSFHEKIQNDNNSNKKLFNIILACLLAIGLFIIGGFLGFYYRDVIDNPTDVAVVTKSDSVQDIDETQRQEEGKGEDRLKSTGEISCLNPYTDEYDEYLFSTELLETEDVVFSSVDCFYEISGENYTLSVQPSYEGVGYMYESLGDIPVYEPVSTPNLDVEYLDLYTEKTVVRRQDTDDQNVWHYDAYFVVGEEQCTQWQGEKPAQACGVSGISLEDESILNVTCKASDDYVYSCDQLMEILSVSKI